MIKASRPSQGREGHVGMEQGVEVMDQGHVGLDQGDVGMVQGDVGVDQGDVGMDQGDVGMDQGDAGVDQGDVGMGEGNTVPPKTDNVVREVVAKPIAAAMAEQDDLLIKVCNPRCQLCYVT